VVTNTQFSPALLTGFQPCPSSIYDKPYTLQPLRIIERSRLPLSFLNPNPVSSSLPATRLFTSCIDSLEPTTESSVNNAQPARLLIACLDPESLLYAVERVKRGVYALCRLCDWVKIGYLDDSSNVAYTPVSRPTLAEQQDGSNGEWWKAAVVGKDITQFTSPVKRPRLSMATPTPAVPKDQPAPSLQAGVNTDITLRSVEPNMDSVEIQVSSQQVFETLVQQYLEALYRSRTSLAFFAKGPLSRARAACAGVEQDEFSTSRLVIFLRSMLLTMASMDKKYKEKLPGMVKELSPMSWSDYEQEGPSSSKKRKSRKLPKLSKDGTYASELDHVKRWWYGDVSRHREETATQLMKRKIGDLRVRETLAQVILILEILALEATADFKTPEVDGQLETQKKDTDAEKKRKRKPKKPTNLVVLLDLLMDKLSIWQSVEIDGGSNTDERGNDNSMQDNDNKIQDRFLLASFCTEVVIPL
jgi:DNA replication regulator SLD3